MPGEINGNIKPLIPSEKIETSIEKKIRESQYKEKLAELAKTDSRVATPSKKSFLEQLGEKIVGEKTEKTSIQKETGSLEQGVSVKPGGVVGPGTTKPTGQVLVY